MTEERREDRGPATILVVEDEDSLRALIARMLSAEGWPRSGRDGRDALRVLEEHEGSVDLVVIDMVMPVMDGATAGRGAAAADARAADPVHVGLRSE